MTCLIEVNVARLYNICSLFSSVHTVHHEVVWCLYLHRRDLSPLVS